MSTPRLDHADALRQAHLKRLALLEEQAARLGYDAPPHVTAEIADIRATLGLIDAATTQPPDDVRRLLRRYDGIDLTINVVSALVVRVSTIEETLRAWQARDSIERQARQRQLDYWLLGLTIAVLVLLAFRVADLAGYL